MLAFIERLQQAGPTRATARDLARGSKRRSASSGRVRPFFFSFRPEEKNFRLTVRFRKSEVSREELVAALRRTLDELTRADRPENG
jgi:hypothetical protein